MMILVIKVQHQESLTKFNLGVKYMKFKVYLIF
jgi:hypothetical protein